MTREAACAAGPSDADIRERIRRAFAALGLLSVHCGGRGLVVGCPVCGRRA